MCAYKEDEEEKYISNDTSLWEDLEPLSQDDDATSFVKIDYPEQMKKAMDLFRRICQLEELSERALMLTAEVILHNAANYTAWVYRRRCLRALNADLREELVYIKDLVANNSKIYQVWHHYRWVVESLKDCTGELDFNELLLGIDGKNVNAWAHRKWLMKTFNLWQGQLEFTSDTLDEDSRNNSAWSFRHFLLTRAMQENPKILENEIEQTMRYIRIDPNHESPYSYLKSIMQFFPSDMEDSRLYYERCVEELISEICRKNPNCRFSLEYLADLQIQNENVVEAKKLYQELAKIDPIRNDYWMWCSEEC